MSQRSNYRITLEDVTDAQISASLRGEIAKRSPDPAISRARAVGLLFGLIIGATAMAAADYGDAWICLGDCRDQIKREME